MNVSQYEKHSFDDPALPIIFHLDHITHQSAPFCLHWHENPEFLFIVKGSGIVKIDDTQILAAENDLIVINPNKMHHVSIEDQSEILYYCLIIDKNFADQFGLSPEENLIQEKVHDPALFNALEQIVRELTLKQPCYKAAVMQQVLGILLSLFREHLDTNAAENVPGKQITMIKKAIVYMKKHSRESLSLADIAQHTGYSKYYFCRTFKAVTGYTVNAYFNSLKIQQAYILLKTDGFSVNETAERCGFSDISYFTKMFKKYMHVLPSSIQKDNTPSFPAP